MKSLTLLLTTLFLFSSPVVWSEEVDYKDLVERERLYYKKFSDEPFTGNVVGEYRGKLVKGKQEGKWTGWWNNGQLMWRGNYKNDKNEGLEEYYNQRGILQRRGYYKNGKRDGLTEYYYYDSRQLKMRGHYKNGKSIGKWEYYNEDGTHDRVEDEGE